MSENPEAYFLKQAEKHLLNRRIVKIRYMTDEEAKDQMWSSRPIVLQLDDGSIIYPSSDDEGNDGGVLMNQTNRGNICFPVMRR